MEKFKKTYDKCPACGSEETVGPRVFAACNFEGMEALNAEVLLLQNPAVSQIVSPMAPALVIKKDYCLDCGMKYVVEFELTQVPVQYSRNNPMGQGSFRHGQMGG